MGLVRREASEHGNSAFNAIQQSVSCGRRAESLTILARVCRIIELRCADPAWMAADQKRVPHGRGLERSFPALCFRSGHGRGKTRLWGVIASSTSRGDRTSSCSLELTIYHKLISDIPSQHAEVRFKASASSRHPARGHHGENTSPGRVRGWAAVRTTASRQHLQYLEVNSEVRGGARLASSGLSEIHRPELFRVSGRHGRLVM